MFTVTANAAFAILRDKWRQVLCNRSSLVELASGPHQQLHRIARDAGVSVRDLRMIADAHPGPRELLPLRLRLLGLDQGFVRSALTTTYRDLEKACATCPTWRRCADDLAKGDVQVGMESYCTCAPAIDALAVDGDWAMTCEPGPPPRRSTSWPMSHKVERRAVRMHEMMTRLHVDPGKLGRLRRGDAYAEARAKCLSCRMSQKCLQWLAQTAHADVRPEFCPNLTLFEACQRDRAAS